MTLGGLAALASVGVLAYTSFLTWRMTSESRACRACNRPGEKVLGLFGATLMQQTEGARPVPVEPVTLIVTNQRIRLHPPPRQVAVPIERDLQRVSSVAELGPVAGPPLQQRVLIRIEFVDGAHILFSMSLSTAHEFKGVRSSHLTPSPRRVRVVVMQASGPTPAKPDRPLADVLDAGKPVVYQFVLAENYLRIIGDRPQLMAELWWYFRWERMRVSELEQAEAPDIPEGWRCLRLSFYEQSWMVVCGPAENIERLCAKAQAGGAQTAANER